MLYLLKILLYVFLVGMIFVALNCKFCYDIRSSEIFLCKDILQMGVTQKKCFT